MDQRKGALINNAQINKQNMVK